MQHDAEMIQNEYPVIDDPQIVETINRLKRKMQDVADAFEATKTPAQRKISAKRNAKSVQKKTGKTRSASPVKRLFLVLLLLLSGFGIASYVNILFEPAIPEQVAAPEIAEPVLLPAQLVLKSASYEILTSELGKTLEITISVENQGDMKGMPEQFSIELVDASSTSLMKWPMQVEGEMIEGRQTRSFVTRLIEPPADFANIRVSMSK